VLKYGALGHQCQQLLIGKTKIEFRLIFFLFPPIYIEWEKLLERLTQLIPPYMDSRTPPGKFNQLGINTTPFPWDLGRLNRA
jgi:hypothetical protein